MRRRLRNTKPSLLEGIETDAVVECAVGAQWDRRRDDAARAAVAASTARTALATSNSVTTNKLGTLVYMYSVRPSPATC